VGPRAGLDGCGKYRLPEGYDPRTVQPVASRYTGVVEIIFKLSPQTTGLTHAYVLICI
jgi:hypothetical protein